MRAAAAGFPADNSLLPGSIGNALLFGGELEQAHRYMSQIGDEGRRRGLRSWVAWSSSMAARYSLELGQVRRAEEEAQLGLELMAQTVADPGPHARGYFTAHLAYALLERNRHDEAEQLLAGSDVPPGEARTYGAALLLGARSRLHLERGRAEDALACARASAATPLRDGNPAARPWRSDAARAFAALGQRDQARRLAQEELELARTFGTPHAITAALRAAARVDDDLSRSTSLLEEAIATVDDTAARLELTRAHVELGAVLRRAGKRRAAIEKLRVGLDLAHRAGATALAERAHRELLTAGARPRRALLSGVDALTVAERRVADLAAKGHTNQQIAQALFVTTRTVEAHLTRAFRKLDVKTRRELPLALADFDDDA
jgi:DNA-binding CsgD family transcriptional regulator